MGGYRARGALATLALSTVVLVAVVLAGTYSMSPIGETGPLTDGGPRRNPSFDVVVPGDVVAPTENEPGGSDGATDGETDGEIDGDGKSESVVVIRQDAPDAADAADQPRVFPTDPLAPLVPTEPPPAVDPPVDPVVDPVDPPVVAPPPPGGYPVPTQPRVPGKNRADKYKPGKSNPREVAGPDRGAAGGEATTGGRRAAGAKATKSGRGRGKSPVVVIRGPRWRPAPPARQTHPTKPGKWAADGSRPGNGKNTTASGNGRSNRAANHTPRPKRRSVDADDRGKRHAVAPRPPKPQRVSNGNGHAHRAHANRQGQRKVSNKARGRGNNHGRSNGRGARGKGGKRR